MDDQERLEQTKILTRFFGEMQGLKIVPIGVFMLLDAGYIWLTRNTLLIDDHPVAATLIIVGLLVFVAVASSLINRYYLANFGRVRLTKPQETRRNRIILLIAMIGAVLLDMWLKLPILLTGLVFSGFVWAGLTHLGKARRDYLWAGLLIALTTFLPLFGLNIRESLNVFIAVIGVVMLLTGLLDHYKLQQLFKQQEVIYDR